MRTMYAVALTAAASVGLATTFNASRAVLPSDSAAPVVGRYQIGSSPSRLEVYLVDTATGDVWLKVDGKWTEFGNPVKGQH